MTLPLARRRGLAPPVRTCLFRPVLLTLEDRDVPAAVPTQWATVGAGGGGALFSPQINPYNPNEYFIASDMSELFHSTDAGALVNIGLSERNMVGTGVDASINGTLAQRRSSVNLSVTALPWPMTA